MRYKTLLFIACVSVTLPLSAQRFSLGVRAGCSLNDEIYYGQYPYSLPRRDYALLPGYNAGIEGRLQLNKRFALSAELQYTQKGYIDRLYGRNGLENARFKLYYGALPILGSFNVWKGLSLQAGVEAAWLLRSRVKFGGRTFDTEALADLYRDFDLGAVASVEYQFGQSFFLNARHIFGLTPRSTTQVTDSHGVARNLHSYNSSTQFSVGYRYYFGQ